MIPQHNQENFDPIQNKYSPIKKKKTIALRQVLRDITRKDIEEKEQPEIKKVEDEFFDKLDDHEIKARNIRDL